MRITRSHSTVGSSLGGGVFLGWGQGHKHRRLHLYGPVQASLLHGPWVLWPSYLKGKNEMAKGFIYHPGRTELSNSPKSEIHAPPHPPPKKMMQNLAMEEGMQWGLSVCLFFLHLESHIHQCLDSLLIFTLSIGEAKGSRLAKTLGIRVPLLSLSSSYKHPCHQLQGESFSEGDEIRSDWQFPAA